MTAPTSPVQIEVDALQQRIKTRPALQPLMEKARAEIAFYTPEAVIDPTKVNLLQDAVESLASLERMREDYLRDDERLRRALELRDREEQQRREDAAAYATQQLQEIHDEFILTARQLCRVYRRALVQARANEQVPGASKAIPLPFHIQSFHPSGWQGDTAQLIRDNSLRWLKQEIEAAGAPALYRP